ncbi:hypothetical protein Y032_0291g1571 [Ancylostoma ceylanicum]|uniref:Uncharacterized protein n=1 Tax=Ancylostoma ceylanicum TaxID=53326 RepID=A0A016S6A4_9BILA|nr:hypothetical protein Y032_0291g1571 [Ancylostoma ceylanicum]
MATAVVSVGRSAGSVGNSIETSKWKESHQLHIKNRSKLKERKKRKCKNGSEKPIGRPKPLRSQMRIKSTMVHVLG